MPRAIYETTTTSPPARTAIIIPFARQAPRSTNVWSTPHEMSRAIAQVERLPSRDLIGEARISMVLADLTSRDKDVRLGCAMRAFLCLARALDEAGFPVQMAGKAP